MSAKAKQEIVPSLASSLRQEALKRNDQSSTSPLAMLKIKSSVCSSRLLPQWRAIDRTVSRFRAALEAMASRNRPPASPTHRNRRPVRMNRSQSKASARSRRSEMNTTAARHGIDLLPVNNGIRGLL